MKLLMTADTIGGVWTYALELAAALASHDVHVRLATMGSAPTPSQLREASCLSNVELISSTYKLEWMSDPWDDVHRAGKWLLELESEYRPDLVHINGYTHAVLPFRAPVVSVAHSCVLSWWQAVKNEPAPMSWNHYAAQVKRGLHAADLVVAPSQAMLEEIHRLYGPLPHTRIIHNGRDPFAFRTDVPKEHFILCAGRLWDEAKNLTALEAIGPGLSWPIYVAGDDRLTDHQGTTPKSVRGLGKLSAAEMADWLSRAAIYVHPAKYEPFGLSALEAALSGCALVLSDLPSLREIWAEAAVYASPRDPSAFAAAIESLIADPQARREMAQRARHRALLYGPHRMAREYLAAYRLAMQHARVAERLSHRDSLPPSLYGSAR